MFTLHVSWLLVAGVPGLLMLAALGLGRLERDLTHAWVAATDIDDVPCPGAVDMRTLAREGMPEALEYLHRCQSLGLCEPAPTGRHALPVYAAPLFAVDSGEHRQAVLAVQIEAHSRINTQFGLTRHVNRV